VTDSKDVKNEQAQRHANKPS